MKSHVFAMIAAAALAAPAAAQSPQTPPSPQTPSTSATAPASADSKTITGCVAPGAGGTFTLSESAAAAPKPTEPTAASGATSSAGRWTLMSKSDVDLSKYVGKRVEITGSADNKGGASADQSSSTTRSDASMSGPRFHVKSVRIVAETCS